MSRKKERKRIDELEGEVKVLKQQQSSLFKLLTSDKKRCKNRYV